MYKFWRSLVRWWNAFVVRPLFRFWRSLNSKRGLFYWLSFRWVFKPLGRFVARFFQFKAPYWLKSIASVAAPPKSPKNTAEMFNPFYWIVWIAQFPLTWMLTRPYLNSGPAIPALVVLVTLVLLWFGAIGSSRASKIDSYRAKMNIALASESYKEARVAARVLTSIFPGNQEFQRTLATIETKCGNKTVAAEMMNRLVAMQNDGDAAIWLVTNVLELQKVREWSAPQHQYFRQLMEVALANLKGGNLDSAKGIMGYYLAELGNPRDALRYFADIAPRNERMYLMAANLAKQSGDDRQAVSYANDALRYFRAAIALQPSNVDLRISEGQALLLMGNFERSIASLGEAYAALRDDKLKNQIALTYVEWATDLGRKENPSKVLIQRLELLRRATAIAPESTLLAEAIADIIIECAQNQDKEVEILRLALAQGISPGMMHFVEGTSALINGESEKARSRLELAAQTMQNVPALLNNLAAAMSSGENENLPRALELVNMADEQMANHPYIRETRGQIYFKLGEDAKAISDLEFSLSSPELRLGAYATLRQAYRKLGQEELANNYEKLYDDLKTLTDAAKDTTLKSNELQAPISPVTPPSSPIPPEAETDKPATSVSEGSSDQK